VIHSHYCIISFIVCWTQFDT